MNDNSLNLSNVYPVLILCAALAIIIVVGRFLIEKKLSRNRFATPTIVWGKIISTGFDEKGKKTITVLYTVGSNNFSATIRKPILIPYKIGWKLRIECNILDPTQARGYSEWPTLAVIFLTIVSAITFFAKMR